MIFKYGAISDVSLFPNERAFDPVDDPEMELARCSRMFAVICVARMLMLTQKVR